METYRGIKEFKKDYLSRTILVNDENGDVLADFHSSVSAVECVWG